MINDIIAIIKLGSEIIDKVIPNPEERDKAKLEFSRLAQAGELEYLKASMSAILMEAQSQDKWTSRARPSFMYVMYIMILTAIPMGILNIFEPEMAKHMMEGVKLWLLAIPAALWTTFDICFTGYSVLRSYDKKQILEKLRK